MPDSILYSLVARGTTVLAEHSTVAGNAHLVAHRILEKVASQDSRVSYSQDRHLFHIVVHNGVTFMCMADEGLGRRTPFAFLEDIKQRFESAYGASAASAVAYEYNTEFSHTLQARMDFFSNDPKADTIKRVRGEISEVRSVMVDNIDKVLDRGERIELLVDKTDHLQSESFAFNREARVLRRRLWWKNVRLLAAAGALVLLIVYIIVAFACSPTFRC